MSGLLSGSGTSGSTAWNNAVRSRLYMTRSTDDDGQPERDKRVLKVMKANYGPDGNEFPLRYDKGVFVREGGAGGIFEHIEKRSADTAFLEALDALTKQRRKVNSYPNQSNYAPKMMVGSPEAGNFRRRDLAKAMERLFHAGKIILLDSGSPSRPRLYIARTPEEQDSEDALL